MLENFLQINPAHLIIIGGIAFLIFHFVSRSKKKPISDDPDLDNKSYQEVLQPLIQPWVERNNPSPGEISSIETGLADALDLLSELSKMNDPASGSEFAFHQLYDGKSQEAINLLSHLTSKKIKAGSPDDLEDASAYSRNLGNLLMLTNTTEAAKAYKQAVELNPDDLYSLSTLGGIHQKQENFKEAEKIFNTVNQIAKRLNQDDFQSFAWANLGAIYWKKNEIQKAEDAFHKSKAINEKAGRQIELIEDCFNLGHAQLFKGNFSKAKGFLETGLSLSLALEKAESTHEFHILLAHVLQLTGQLDPAQEQLEKALEIGEQFENETMKAAAYSGLGNTCFTRGQLKEAEKYHQQAIQIFKNSNDTTNLIQELISLGFTQLEKKEISNALDNSLLALETGKKQDNESALAGAYACLGSTYQEMDEFSKAEVNFFRAIKILENSTGNEDYLALLYGNLGWFYVQAKEPEKAKQYIERSIEICMRLGLKITLAHQHDSLGQLLHQLGKVEEGIQSLQKANALFHEIGAELEVEKIQAKLIEWGEKQ